ncbi:hypothetical protein D3C80_1936220 [compost metagenome]
MRPEADLEGGFVLDVAHGFRELLVLAAVAVVDQHPACGHVVLNELPCGLDGVGSFLLGAVGIAVSGGRIARV